MYSFIIHGPERNKILHRNTLLCASGDVEVFGKIFPPGNPKSLSCGKERGKEDGELFFCLAYI